jgi:hypothetical protein
LLTPKVIPAKGIASTQEQTMNKRLAQVLSVILALTLIFGSFISGRAKAQLGPVMPERLINLAHFYKPPSNMDAPTLAGKSGFILLTGGDEVFRDKVIASGFTSTIPQYFSFLGIQDPGGCTASTRNNQVAYKVGDFCDISQNHPDWFLLDTNGQRIRMSPSSDVYRMDPGNPGWRNFFVTRVLEWQSQTGWSALFLDYLESSLDDLRRNGTVPAKYPDDASYRAAILGFLEYLHVNYSQPYDRPVLANITMGLDEATWSSYMQYLDGAMQERWVVGWSVNEYESETKWKADLARAEKFQNQGKYMILVAPGNQTDTNRQIFAFASYLLISHGKAAFRYSNSDIYREVWLYNNYQVDLGTPLGSRYQSGNLWRRDFTKGFVTVDPVNHTASISAGNLSVSTFTCVPTAVVPTTQVPPTSTITDPAGNALGGLPYTAGEIHTIARNNGADTTGVFRPMNGILFLKHTHNSGFADVGLNYGIPGDYPVVGDWDGDGTVTIGIYRNGMFYLRNENTNGFATIVFYFGQPCDQPIAGDWNGDGMDTIGIFRPSNGLFLLSNNNDAGPAEMSFYLGNVGDVGIAGDWDGNGKDTTGVFRPSNGIIFLKNTNTTGFADTALNYGIPGDKPVMGDWNNDGIDTIGVYRNGRFFLRNSNDVGFAEIVFDLGNPGDMPIAGNWDGLP